MANGSNVTDIWESIGNNFVSGMKSGQESALQAQQLAEKKKQQEIDDAVKLTQMMEKMQEVAQRQAYINQRNNDMGSLTGTSTDKSTVSKMGDLFGDIYNSPQFKDNPHIQSMKDMPIPKVDDRYEMTPDGKFVAKKVDKPTRIIRELQDGSWVDGKGAKVDTDNLDPKYEWKMNNYTKSGQSSDPRSPEMARLANSLRDDFNKEAGSFTTIRKNYQDMETALKRSETSGNKIAIDQAIITTYNKILDPTSVVRESEYARTPENLSLINRLQGYAEKIKKGGAGLTDKDRKEIIDMTREFYKNAQSAYATKRQQYGKNAKYYGIPEDLVVGTDMSLKLDEPASDIPQFASEAEAEEAKLPKGAIVMIGGRKARVR